ncbi:hypothetical protein ACSBR1_018610 [Camellia fascicularis]
MVVAAMGLLIGKIVSALENKASLIGGVRDLAYKVEDIIDEYMYYMNKQKVYGKFTRFLRQIVYTPKNIWVRHRIATKLQKISCMIKAIPERNRRYRVDRIGGASSSSQDHQRQLPNHSESSLFYRDDDLVGIEDGKEQLLGWLMDKEDPQCTVISVVGMGGSDYRIKQKRFIRLWMAEGFVEKVQGRTPEEVALLLGLRLLRVLDLEDAPIEVLPEELVDLFNLSYLNLKGTRVKELPKSVGRLRNLNTLDITNSKIEVLPAGITELRNLLRLMMYHSDIGIFDEFHFDRRTTTTSNIFKLKNLQVLAGVEAQADLMKRIRNMTQLKKIGITKVREVDEDLCTAIQNMSLLHFLSVKVIDEDEYLQMDALSSTPPRYLKKLILVGKLEKVPCWFHSLQNLTSLLLRWSRLPEDPIPYI